MALGAIHELTRPEDIQRVCALAGADSEDSPATTAAWRSTPPSQAGTAFGPRRFVLPRIELVRRGVHQPLPQPLADSPAWSRSANSKASCGPPGASPKPEAPCPHWTKQPGSAGICRARPSGKPLVGR